MERAVVRRISYKPIGYMTERTDVRLVDTERIDAALW